MTNSLTDLFRAIVTYVTEHDGYMTKTKLLKLLYLLDVEFYRVHGKTFTNFHWRYFHLGPWTNEFDPLLDQLVSTGELTEHVTERSEFDAKFLRASSHVDLRAPFSSYQDEAILKIVLDTWGQSSTAEILDYVYFRTEPMEYGTRSEILDFSKIPQHALAQYKREPSNKTASAIRRLKQEFTKKIAARATPQVFRFTKPRYDEEFSAAIEKLDNGHL